MNPAAQLSIKVYRAHETVRMLELEGLELASFGRRSVAFAVDFLLAAALFMALGFAVIQVLPKIVHFEGDHHLELDFFHNWYSVVYLVTFFGLSTYIGNGRTLGKRLTGIRVVSLVHHRLSLWHSIERALGYGASALELGFGFIQFFIEPNRRTVHDRIAETIVIKEPVPDRILPKPDNEGR